MVFPTLLPCAPLRISSARSRHPESHPTPSPTSLRLFPCSFREWREVAPPGRGPRPSCHKQSVARACHRSLGSGGQIPSSGIASPGGVCRVSRPAWCQALPNLRQPAGGSLPARCRPPVPRVGIGRSKDAETCPGAVPPTAGPRLSMDHHGQGGGRRGSRPGHFRARC